MSLRTHAGWLACVAALAGCHSSQLPECEALNSTIARSSVEMQRSFSNPAMPDSKLAEATRVVASVKVKDPALGTLRDAYVKELGTVRAELAQQRDPASPRAAALREARARFDDETRKALDSLNLVCSGAR